MLDITVIIGKTSKYIPSTKYFSQIMSIMSTLEVFFTQEVWESDHIYASKILKKLEMITAQLHHLNA